MRRELLSFRETKMTAASHFFPISQLPTLPLMSKSKGVNKPQKIIILCRNHKNSYLDYKHHMTKFCLDQCLCMCVWLFPLNHNQSMMLNLNLASTSNTIFLLLPQIQGHFGEQYGVWTCPESCVAGQWKILGLGFLSVPHLSWHWVRDLSQPRL